MGKLKVFALIILIAMAAGAGNGLIYGQSYALYPLYIYGEHADLASDNNNNLHVIWLRYGTMYYGRIINNAISGTQTVPSTTNAVAVPWSWPHIAVSLSGDTVHVLWVGGNHRNLFHSWRNSSGTWTTETVRTSSYGQFFWPVCAIDAVGNVHAIYGNSPGDGNCDVFYTIKSVAGSWSTPVEISGGDTHLNTTNPDFSEYDMFSDSNGGIHAKWSLINTRYMRYRYCASNGSLASASTEYMLDNGATSIGPGDLHVEKSGIVHMGFNAYNGNVNMDHSYKPVGGSWTAPTQARTAANTAHEIWPTIAVPRDGSNRVFVAWAEGPSSVKMSVKDGGSWTLYDLDTAAGMYDDWIKPAMTATDSSLCGLWRNGSASNYSWVLGVIPTRTVTLTAPNGGENWVRTTSQNITWTSNGVTGTVKLLLYQNLSLIGTIAQDLAVGTGTYSWTVGNMTTGSAPAGSNYKVRIQTTDGVLSDDTDGTFTIVSEIETVSAPTTLTGPAFGSTGTSYTYMTGGALSSHGHTLQYKFDWGDGSVSDWLAVGTTSASHSWSSTGTFSVRTMARCSLHTTIESPWSTTLAVVIAVPGSYFNSPANRLILPEVNWASASGGGTWVPEVQLVDVSGGSTVHVYYNTGTSRRGPFTLWTNSGGAYSSIKFANVLQTIDGLDPSANVYLGTGGSLEMITQDGSHNIQAALRSYNGNFSRTFPALADIDTNTAVSGRSLLVPNMSMDAAFRPSLVLFNPSADSVTANVQIIGSNGSQVGSTISKTVAGYEMTGVAELRNYTYSNADFWVTVTGGSGRLIVSGQSANNTSNDPAAHVAVQAGPGYVNSPAVRLIFPEANWASASGGGDWVSEVHITDLSGGSMVQAYYNMGTERRGPFTLWTNGGGANCSVTFSNVLQTIDGLDGSAAVYYGTGGALELVTQDGSHLIQAALRCYNGNSTRTIPAFQDVEANTAAIGRSLMIPNICNDTQYRPSVALFNTTADSVTAELRIIGSDGAQIGSTINRTLAGYEMSGVGELRNYTYSNAFVRITVTGGSGRVMASGQSANNTSNDPAAHVAVQAY